MKILRFICISLFALHISSCHEPEMHNNIVFINKAEADVLVTDVFLSSFNFVINSGAQKTFYCVGALGSGSQIFCFAYELDGKKIDFLEDVSEAGLIYVSDGEKKTVTIYPGHHYDIDGKDYNYNIEPNDNYWTY